MRAALVHSFDHPPQPGTFADPTPAAGDLLLTVRAAAVSQLTRAVAAGKHYSAAAGFPFIPGFDGVGVLADGTRMYFAGPARPYGAMAEQVAIPRARCAPIPAALDDVTAAAVANPAMSSWAALTARAGFTAGEAVLINGATGASGRVAIAVARHLGARTIIATGRTARSVAPLHALGADVTIALDLPTDELRAALAHAIGAHQVGVVLDYLWGPPAGHVIAAIAAAGQHDGGARIRFVQIGALAGAELPLAGGVLRSTRLELLGSGLGSVAIEALVAMIGQALAALPPAELSIATEVVPLAAVEAAWARPIGDRRLVVTP
jgi:NADPH:quinone reductase-like Zn-dependent oxidoreductase